jgi:hypothetical protein
MILGGQSRTPRAKRAFPGLAVVEALPDLVWLDS